MGKFREMIMNESKSFEIEINDGAKKYNKIFKGRSAEMLEFASKQKGFKQVGFWEDQDDTNFEIFFETNAQALAIVKKFNAVYGYWFKSIGNNGRIVEMTLNEAGFKEFL